MVVLDHCAVDTHGGFRDGHRGDRKDDTRCPVVVEVFGEILLTRLSVLLHGACLIYHSKQRELVQRPNMPKVLLKEGIGIVELGTARELGREHFVDVELVK